MSTVSLDGTTRLDNLRQSGSLKVLFPRTDHDALQAVIVNTAGGATGGDRFEVCATAHDGSSLCLTTQAAERAYRATAGEQARISNRISIGKGARVNWLPQETILFDGSNLRRKLSVDIEESGSLLFCEPLVLGRLEMGEAVNSAFFSDSVEVRSDGAPIFLDSIRFDGDPASLMDSPTIGNGSRAMASLVFVDQSAQARLPIVRSMLPDTAGASMLSNDLLVARILARDSFELRQTLVPLLKNLTEDNLPRCWTI